MKTKFGLASGLAVLMLGGCVNTAPYPPNPNLADSGRAYPAHGVVQSVELVRPEKAGIAGSDIGLGTVAGALIGGVLGSQVGNGRGSTVAAVAGVAGGAYVGHELENRERVDALKITVRMNDGSYQTLMQSSKADFRVGDRVRLENGNLQRY